MCLPVYRLFWVSSLAYPNLLGTKGYVVVVVVVVTSLFWMKEIDMELTSELLNAAFLLFSNWMN
jgi:hypothetical protein